MRHANRQLEVRQTGEQIRSGMLFELTMTMFVKLQRLRVWVEERGRGRKSRLLSLRCDQIYSEHRLRTGLPHSKHCLYRQCTCTTFDQQLAIEKLQLILSCGSMSSNLPRWTRTHQHVKCTLQLGAKVNIRA